MKKQLLTLLLLSLTLTASAQLDWGITYNTEGHYGMNRNQAAWANLLNLDLGIGLWQNGTLELSALSSYDTRQSVTDDRQVYSNIVADDRALSLFVMEIVQHWDRVGMCVGLGHINDHFFATPHSGLFTGASHGIFPTVGDNFGLGNFPVSSLGIGIDAAINDHLHAHLHCANGAASDKIGEQFRLRPDEDGLLGIAELRWENDKDNEHRGSWHAGAVTSGHKGVSTGTSFFAYGDQPFVSWGEEGHAGVLLQGSWASGDAISCRSYYGVGLWGDAIGRQGIYAGAIANRAVYVDGWETDIELTSIIPLTPWLQLQPAIHFIDTDDRWDTVAMLRATISLE